jgi:hypothetical protein
VLVGTIEEMGAQLTCQAEQLGISRYVVRETALGPAERILSLLNAR